MKNSRALAETYVQPVVAGLLVLVTLIGLIGPAIKSPQPHDIPVGIVSPPGQSPAASFAPSGPFKVTTFDSEAAARAAIDSRDIDGALVPGPDGPKLIVAGAAGDGVTGVITGGFTQAFAAQGQRLTVEIVHPFSAGDSHGLILFFVVLAILVSTLIVNAIVGLRRQAGMLATVVLVAAFALLAAPVAMGLATWIAGDYGSGFWTATALLALAAAAVGAVIAGMARLLGAAGVALAALVAVLFDLVASGGPIGSSLLPDAYRWFAPAMPAGQVYSGVRGALYFDNAGTSEPVFVLSLWLLAGLVLLALSRFAPHGADR
jgi:hypothetical protein